MFFWNPDRSRTIFRGISKVFCLEVLVFLTRQVRYDPTRQFVTIVTLSLTLVVGWLSRRCDGSQVTMPSSRNRCRSFHRLLFSSSFLMCVFFQTPVRDRCNDRASPCGPGWLFPIRLC